MPRANGIYTLIELVYFSILNIPCLALGKDLSSTYQFWWNTYEMKYMIQFNVISNTFLCECELKSHHSLNSCYWRLHVFQKFQNNVWKKKILW